MWDGIFGWLLIACGLILAAPGLGLFGFLLLGLLLGLAAPVRPSVYPNPSAFEGVQNDELGLALSVVVFVLGLAMVLLRHRFAQQRRWAGRSIAALGAILAAGGGLCALSAILLWDAAVGVAWGSDAIEVAVAIVLAPALVLGAILFVAGLWFVNRPRARGPVTN